MADNFFSNTADLPDVNASIGGTDTEGLISAKDIGREVHKEYVNTALINESDTIEYPMVCIKANKVNHIYSFAYTALRALLESCKVSPNDVDDTVPVYIFTHSSKMMKIGEASYNKLYRYIDSFVKCVINQKLRVYYFKSESEKERIDKADPSRIKLDI